MKTTKHKQYHNKLITSVANHSLPTEQPICIIDNDIK